MVPSSRLPELRATASGVEPLKEFFLGLAGAPGGARSPPPVLFELARQVLRRSRQAHLESDDLVAALLEQLVAGTRSENARSIDHLLELSEPQLRGVLRHRFRQIAAELNPEWRLVRQLRAQVQAALCRELPEMPSSRPESLIQGQKLRPTLVGPAVAWVLGQEDAPPRTVSDVSARLFDLYFRRELPVEAGGQTEMPSRQDSPEEEARRSIDSETVFNEVERCLPPEMIRILRFRFEGLSLPEVARRERISVSTAHDRLHKGIEFLRRYAATSRTSLET